MKQIDVEEGMELVATRACGECGSPLVLPWGGSYGIEGYIIRCAKDINHEGFIKPKSYYRAWKDGEAIPLVIANHFEKQRRKQLENTVGKEKSRDLIPYQGSTALTKEQAIYILQTIWPEAPKQEIAKATILCCQYRLNPLMKHIFLIPFKNKQTGEITWSMVLGIGATRLIASRKGGYSYADGPRLMTDEEQAKILGAVDTLNLWAITVLERNGNRAPGYGNWPKDTQPKGTEKGNTKANMAFVRSERNAFNRLLPGEMPADVGVIDSDYVPDIKIADVTPTGELSPPKESPPPEEVHPWRLACPEHGIAWIDGKYGLFHALDEQKDGKTQWCKASTVFGDKFKSACDVLGWDKPKADAWLKEYYGGTWSKISDEQRIGATDCLSAMLSGESKAEGEIAADELPF